MYFFNVFFFWARKLFGSFEKSRPALLPIQINLTDIHVLFSQVWPIPCVIGAIVGYIIGLGASAVTFALNEKRFRPR